MPRGYVSTADILRARGVEHVTTLGRDTREGLFKGCEPILKSEGPHTGVFNIWPRRAVRRAEWIRDLLALGLKRGDIRELVDKGRRAP